MTHFIPGDNEGWSTVYRLEREGHGRVVHEHQPRQDFITRLATPIVGGLIDLCLVRPVSRGVDRVFAKLNAWRERRRVQRIIEYNERYRQERRRLRNQD
jgi:hypothetical protein